MPHPTHHRLRRPIWGVLLAWWCVVLVGMVAPWVPHTAQAATAPWGMERVCADQGAPQWAPSPVAGPHHGSAAPTHLHHLVDCPLCLPALAPPPLHTAAAVHALPEVALWVAGGAQAVLFAIAWPPARAPPVTA